MVDWRALGYVNVVHIFPHRVFAPAGPKIKMKIPIVIQMSDVQELGKPQSIVPIPKASGVTATNPTSIAPGLVRVKGFKPPTIAPARMPLHR